MNLTSDEEKIVLDSEFHNGTKEVSVSLAEVSWEEVEPYMVLSMFLLVSVLAKLMFHTVHWLSTRVPESCVLILVGLIFGGVLYAGRDSEELSKFPHFTPELFFYILLPPIILESAYSLHNKVFFVNIGPVLMYAVVGTTLNFILIGSLLILVQYMRKIILQDNDYGDQPTPSQVLLFASLISAVDPVAVLAIFGEIGVNPTLYYLVFGESLLNDGIAVVFYSMMNTFTQIESGGGDVTSSQIILGICTFFTIAFGGLLIGVIFGFISAIVTKFTEQLRIVEPVVIFVISYMSYLVADMFGWSGIISLIGCGLIQAHYAFKNISSSSQTTVEHVIEILSNLSDCIIFLYLGMALCHSQLWDTWFILWSLLICFIVRYLGVYFLTMFTGRNIDGRSQFIMGYAGLRGAVGFSLVSMISPETVPAAPMFVTTTLAVIVCTVFVQGGSIRYLVNFLNIEKKGDEDICLSDEVHGRLMDQIMTGVEVIAGEKGHYYSMQRLAIIDQFLKSWFCVDHYDIKLKKIYEQVSLEDHIVNLYAPSLVVNDEGDDHGITNIAFKNTEDTEVHLDIAPKHSVKSLARSVSWLAALGFNNKNVDKSKHRNIKQAFNISMINQHNTKGSPEMLENVFAKKKEQAMKLKEKIMHDTHEPIEPEANDMMGNVPRMVKFFDNTENDGVQAVLRKQSINRRKKSSVAPPHGYIS